MLLKHLRKIVRSYNKIIFITLLTAFFYAFTTRKPIINILDYSRITNDTIPEVVVSSKKTERYQLYLKSCNELVSDTILQTGYLNYDTLRVATIPANQLYFNKIVIKSLQISKDLANIIVMDTIWNEIEAPEYQSYYDYYIIAKYPMPPRKTDNFDYSNKIIVFRPRIYTLKRSKPLPYNDWDRFINNKPTRVSTSEQYF
ncbi:MAG: hypothetical protein WAO52_05230 [Prolixibacteraceae bacterium]